MKKLILLLIPLLLCLNGSRALATGYELTTSDCSIVFGQIVSCAFQNPPPYHVNAHIGSATDSENPIPVVYNININMGSTIIIGTYTLVVSLSNGSTYTYDIAMSPANVSQLTLLPPPPTPISGIGGTMNGLSGTDMFDVISDFLSNDIVLGCIITAFALIFAPKIIVAVMKAVDGRRGK